jgi:hypothetical protein
MRSPLLKSEPKTLEPIFYRLVKTSDALRPYVQHYERLHKDHTDRSYQFLSDMINKTIEEVRQRRNQEALVL